MVCAVCDITIWRHIHVSKPTFWRSLLTQYAYSSPRTVLILCVFALNINYQRSKFVYRRKYTQRCDTIWQLRTYQATRWNRGVKHTRHYVRANCNSEVRLRCLNEYEQSSIGMRLDWLAHTPVCKIESCQTTQELRMRIKYARKHSVFGYV